MTDYLPKPYLVFLENHKEIAEAYSRLGEACNEGGPLDPVTRHLVKLGVATALRSEGAVKAHARQALEAGASEAKVRHAVLLALTTGGFPGMIAAMGWVNEVVDARRKRSPRRAAPRRAKR